MPLKCVCLPINDKGMQSAAEHNCVGDVGNRKTDIDMCKILNRTQDKANKHNNYECHLRGERRQNIINKLKMFLDDIDDR